MDIIQTLMSRLAERGIERTPAQAAQLLRIFEKLIQAVDESTYNFWNNLDAEQLALQAHVMQDSLENMTLTREMIICAYNHKMGVVHAAS
jgi:hypothetical protein